MRHCIFILCLFMSITAVAQKGQISGVPDQFLPNNSTVHQVAEYHQHALFNPTGKENLSLALDTVIQSLTGQHEHYRVIYQGQPILNATYTIHRFDAYVNVRTSDLDFVQAKYSDQQDYWVLIDQELIGVQADTLRETDDIPLLRLTSSDLEDTYQWTLGLKDQQAQATGNIFLPDPVTTANTSYGGMFQDFSNATNAALDAEMTSVQLDVTFENNLYVLKNDFVEIAEHSAPTVLPVTSATPVFDFDRSQSGFEDVNVLYHITEYQKYVQSLGFNNLANFPLPCDAHGFNGQDQSAFIWSPQQLIFGEGGVDDAEDADVIIHEYGHVLSFGAAPFSATGGERRAVDEGLGDYLAASYSRSISEHDWYKVFNWDGHNQFWPGRLAISSAHYPEDLVSNLYADAPMWSATMMEVESYIGRDVMHQLIFESMFSWFSGMTMAESAQLIIEADSNLNNGVNYGFISHIFWDRGFIDTSYVERPDALSTAFTELANDDEIAVLISANPSQIGSPLRIDVKQTAQLTVFDMYGRLILQQQVTQGEQSIEIPKTQAGMYFIRVTGASDEHVILKHMFTH